MKDDAQGLASNHANQRAPRDVVTVKKYANRRLYNTATSSYVTLENLAAMARDGTDFVVQDAKTGEDITRSVLTQIIFEEESRGHAPLLPTSFLRQLIRLYGDALQGYVPGYLEMTMHAFERNQEQFRAQMEKSFGKTPGFAQFEAMSRANMEMFRKAMTMFAPFSDAARSTGPDLNGDGVAAKSTADDADLASLREQLLAMQRKVDALVKEQTARSE